MPAKQKLKGAAESGSDAPTCSRRESPADICLEKRTTWVDFDPTKDVVDLADDHHKLGVTIEHRAWVCPFCEQSTEYWLVNGMVVTGCGMSTRWSNGKRSDCCDRYQCRDKQEQFHSENAEAIRGATGNAAGATKDTPTNEP
jgi:hypothetical protein